MPIPSWSALPALWRAVLSGQRRVVGWGASGSFRVLWPECPLPLAYLIDSDPDKQGRTLNGFAIRPPTALAEEDPARTVVVVYSAYFHGAAITAAIEALGPFAVLMPLAPAFAMPQWERCAALLATTPALDRPPARRPPLLTEPGWVVQGAITAETGAVVRLCRAVAPESAVVLSTWDDSPVAALTALEPWCDRIVLSPRPAVAGQGNRNLQAVSTRAGLAAAAALGLAQAFKIRTDTAVLAPAAPAFARQRLAAASAIARPRSGSGGGDGGMLLVTSRYTQKYIPYNVSDLVLFGSLEALQHHYAAPLDLREMEIHSPSWRQVSLATYSREMAIPEVYFTVQALRAHGETPDFTLADSWDVLARRFVVVDEEELEILWPKYGQIPVTRQNPPFSPRRVVDHAFWLRLAHGLDATADRQALDIDRVRFDDFYRCQFAERGLSASAQ